MQHASLTEITGLSDQTRISASCYAILYANGKIYQATINELRSLNMGVQFFLYFLYVVLLSRNDISFIDQRLQPAFTKKTFKETFGLNREIIIVLFS